MDNVPIHEDHHRQSRSDGSAYAVCPHDCPSACALSAEILDERTIRRLRGHRANPYTHGVICG